MAVSFDPKQETNDFGTSASVFSSVELGIRAIISFKVISWYEVALLVCQREDSKKHTTNRHNYQATCSRQSLKATVQVEVEATTSQPASH